MKDYCLDLSIIHSHVLQIWGLNIKTIEQFVSHAHRDTSEPERYIFLQTILLLVACIVLHI